MSVKLMDRVFELNLETTLKFVLLVMADAADHDGSNAYPKVSTICRMTSLGESTVRRALGVLKKLGYLTVEENSKGREATSYRVSPSPPATRPLFTGPLAASNQGSISEQSGVQQRAKNEDVSLLTRPLTVPEPSLSIAFESALLTVNQAQDLKLNDTYPWIDRQTEYRKMSLWREANAKGRTKNVLAFCMNWFNHIPCPKGKRNGQPESFQERRSRDSAAAIQKVLGRFEGPSSDLHGTLPPTNK